MPSYKVSYFDAEGRGEPIRLVLTYLGEKFDDNRITFEDWPAKKKETPFGKLPTLEVDGKVLQQSYAITRYLGRIAKLAGKDDWESLQIDMAADTLEDLVAACNNWYVEDNPERKAQKKEALVKETGPFILSKLDEQISKNKGYLANGNLSWADLYLFAMSKYLNSVLESDIFEKYPNMKALRDNVLAVPKIKAWVEKRPEAEW